MPAATACHVRRGQSKAQEQDEARVGKMDEEIRAAMAAPNPGQKSVALMAAKDWLELSEYARGWKNKDIKKNGPWWRWSIC